MENDMDQFSQEEEAAAVIREMKQVIRIIRTLADTLEPEPSTRRLIAPQTDGLDRDEVDIPAQPDAKSFISTIRNALDLVNGLLETRGGKSSLIFIGQNYKGIFTILKRFSEVLGPVTMFYSVAAGLCYFDYRMHSGYMKTFKNQLELIDRQITDLTKSFETIRDMMKQVTEDIQTVISPTELVSINVDHINELFDQIEVEIVVANIHVRTAEDLLEKLNILTCKYRNRLVIRNTIVAAVYGSVLFGLYRNSYINLSTASVGSCAGVIPYCCSYFWLSLDLQQLLIDLKRKEINNVALKKELEVFEVRMKAAKKKHEKQDVDRCPNQRIR